MVYLHEQNSRLLFVGCTPHETLSSTLKKEFTLAMSFDYVCMYVLQWYCRRFMYVSTQKCLNRLVRFQLNVILIKCQINVS
jgi:hypothetical protein